MYIYTELRKIMYILKFNSRTNSFLSSPMFAGIGPSKLVLYASGIFKFLRFPIDNEIRPDKLVLYKPIPAKFVRPV
jgi:hypothetical protein